MEGDTDLRVFTELILKVNSAEARIYPLICEGVGTLMKRFPSLVRRFEFIDRGRPVTAAFVIRDGDGKDAAELKRQMREKIGNRTYSFGEPELCIVQRCTDTWLLADHHAINAVANARGGRSIGAVVGMLESIPYPKQRMRSLLTEAKLNYTPTVLGEIARNIDLQALTNRIPSYAEFRQAVLRAKSKGRT